MAKPLLVLNDSENTLGEVVQALSSAGYLVYQSTNSDDLVEWFPATKSDILFLSLKATGALDALSVIQMDPESADVKTYFTGDGSEGIKNTSAAVSRGGTDFLKLPVAPTEAVKLAREAAGPGADGPVPVPEGAPDGSVSIEEMAEPEPHPSPSPS